MKRRTHAVIPAVLLAAILTLAAVPSFAADRPTDADVSAAVKTELVLDPAVRSNDITVDTNAGVVTLTGTVDNITARKRAERLAGTVRGVRSVVDLIVVEPAVSVGGKLLAQTVKDALYADPATDSYQLDVSAEDDGRVTLRGTVDSWTERRLAEDVAGNVAGVTSIDNKVHVRDQTQRSDFEIRADVEARLKWDVNIDATGIGVTVNDGKVSLSGTVPSAAERNRALRESWASGVKGVDADGLKVTDALSNNWKRQPAPFVASDSQITDAVDAAMLFDPRVREFDIHADVENGVVTLSGIVDNLRARSAAFDDAMNTEGVVRVQNNITVETGVELADSEIEQYAHAALERDPFVNAGDIDVDVTAGDAMLTGAVDTYFEKGEAEDDVSRVIGVTSVTNDIHVETNDNVFLYNPYVDTWRPNLDWYSLGNRTTEKSDKSIHDAIKTQLWWSPYVDAEDVHVAVHDGVATLTGTVDNDSERRAAEHNAFDGGAIWVRNQLKVRGKG